MNYTWLVLDWFIRLQIGNVALHQVHKALDWSHQNLYKRWIKKRYLFLFKKWQWNVLHYLFKRCRNRLCPLEYRRLIHRVTQMTPPPAEAQRWILISRLSGSTCLLFFSLDSTTVILSSSFISYLITFWRQLLRNLISRKMNLLSIEIGKQLMNIVVLCWHFEQFVSVGVDLIVIISRFSQYKSFFCFKYLLYCLLCTKTNKQTNNGFTLQSARNSVK